MSKPGLFRAAFILGLMTASPGWCQKAGDHTNGVLPNFDIRDAETRGEPSLSQQSQARMLVERRTASLRAFLASPDGAGARVRIAPNRFGMPKVLLREGGVLSPPSALAPEDTAKNFLRTHASLFPLSPSEVDRLRLLVKDTGDGPTFLAFNQTVNGIDVLNGQIKFTLSKTGEIVQVAAGDLVPQLDLPNGSRAERVGGRAARPSFHRR